jgi:hypothetical protein
MKQKKQEDVPKTEELLSINKKPSNVTVEKTIQVTKDNSSTEEIMSSVFSSGVIEEKTIAVEKTVEVIEKPVEPEKLVYEVVFMEGRFERILYTHVLPTFETTGYLRVDNPFGREDFKENILGRKEISASSRKLLEDSEVFINLKTGILVKGIEEEAWMSRDFEETKNLFDRAVLEAYRAFSAQGITTTINNPVNKVVKSSTKDKVVQDTPIAEQEINPYQAGNIPVKRPPIIQDI